MRAVSSRLWKVREQPVWQRSRPKDGALRGGGDTKRMVAIGVVTGSSHSAVPAVDKRSAPASSWSAASSNSAPWDEEALRELAQASPVRTFDPGVALFHEGDPGTVLFLIEAGHVKVLRTGSDGQETLLHVYGPGECLAEMALVDGRPRSASAVAVDQVKARVIYRDHFLTLLQRSPAIA